MMLDYLGEARAAKAIDAGIRTLLTSGKVRSLSAGTHPCSQIGDWMAEEVRKTKA
jgi:isocitrate/isopropylmalate dehydrogenase